MTTSRLQMNANGRRIPFFAGPALSSADSPWAGYYFEEANGRLEPLPSHSWPKTTLLYVTGGCGSLNWKHRGIWRKDAVRRGTVSIIRRDVEIQSAVPTAATPMMVLQLDNSKLQHLAPDNVIAIDNFLETAQVASDVRLAMLLAAMCEEVREGCPSGRLFGESISLALLAYLAARYASASHVNQREASLSPAQKSCLVNYIQENLTSNISVTELAGLLQMSPSHFTRVFKAVFGVTPYRFVMRERIEGAKGMLATTKLSASQISSVYGFSSQSHFAKVFREVTGVTPKQYKVGL
ncbi:AraC family transcriptional regulator [Hyphomicrobium sp.]|uniref:helix-turn-helix transcriptional regulator n=1 Tax=Hyphomicrobium sp. TaxID=82 RepID=UPI001DA24278|nr:AraC family transcriptional regulator [Hyphomicrobium sp.]MBY0562498.1 AraC family transcriptional regulator [Hyphomicrobium sp.]